MNILVTGAAGYIATWVIRDFLRNGHSVTGVDVNQLTRERINFIGSFDFKFFHLSVREFLLDRPDLSGFDVVLPLNGQLGSVESVEHPLKSLMDGGTATMQLLEAVAHAMRQPRVVFVSSDLCYQQKMRCFYSLHKRLVEDMLRIFNDVYGLPYVALRTGTCYGPLQKRDSVVNFYIKRALAGEALPVYGTGTNRQAFIYIEDAARCIVKACEGELIENTIHPLIAHNVSILDLATCVIECVGSGHVKHIDWPYLASKVNVGDLPIMLLPPKGWYSRVGLADGIRLTVEWLTS